MILDILWSTGSPSKFLTLKLQEKRETTLLLPLRLFLKLPHGWRNRVLFSGTQLSKKQKPGFQHWLSLQRAVGPCAGLCLSLASVTTPTTNCVSPRDWLSHLGYRVPPSCTRNCQLWRPTCSTLPSFPKSRPPGSSHGLLPPSHRPTPRVPASFPALLFKPRRGGPRKRVGPPRGPAPCSSLRRRRPE